MPRRIVVISTASGSGKTTVGRLLAERLDVPFHELDALHHGPGWVEATPAELRSRVEPIVAASAWVIDGAYTSKLGTLVFDHADLILWLDLPPHIWFPRLVRRTLGRAIRREELWNGNRETLRSTLLSRDSVIFYAVRNAPQRRRRYRVELAGYPVVRLRSSADLDRWLNAVGAT